VSPAAGRRPGLASVSSGTQVPPASAEVGRGASACIPKPVDLDDLLEVMPAAGPGAGLGGANMPPVRPRENKKNNKAESFIQFIWQMDLHE